MSVNLSLLEFLDEETDYTCGEMWHDAWDHTLLAAALNGRTEIVCFLLDDKEAKFDYSDHIQNESTTAFGFPAFRGRNDTVRLPPKRGTDIDGTSGTERAPLSLAVKGYDFPRTVELPLENGAPVRPRFLETVAREFPVLSGFSWRRVSTRLDDGGKAALKTAVDEERQGVVDLFKTYGASLTEE